MDYKAENEAKKSRIKKIKEAKGKLLQIKKEKNVKEKIVAFKNSVLSSTRKTALLLGTFLMTSGPVNGQHFKTNDENKDNDKQKDKTETTVDAVNHFATDENLFLYGDYASSLVEETVDEVSIDELKTEVINAHIEGTIQNAYDAYVDVKEKGRKALKNRYPDTYNQERNSYYYCLRSQTKAIEEYASQNNIEYMSNIFVEKMNLAGCAQFCEQVTKMDPEVIYGKKYVSPKAKKVSYHPINLYPEDIRVGDIILLESKENNISGLHAVRSVGHEYDEIGNVTSCIMLSLNTESFRRLGSKGIYSSVSIPDYENNKLFQVTSKETKGMVVRISDLMDKALNSEIETHFTENMTEKEKDEKAREVVNNYIGSIDLENSNSTLYNKSGKELVDAINKEETGEIAVEKNKDLDMLVAENFSHKLILTEFLDLPSLSIANNMEDSEIPSIEDLKQRLKARKDDEFRYTIIENNNNPNLGKKEQHNMRKNESCEYDVMNKIIKKNRRIKG